MKDIVLAWPSKGSATFWVLTLLLTACFALGGSARGDIASLMVLRPLAILILGFGLWRLQWAQVRAHRFLFAIALAIVVLPALQLIPLPPSIWNNLPGRGLIVDIDRVAGLGQIWRPLSLAPLDTRNALFATLVPFAVLVLGVQLEDKELFRLLPIVLALSGISALLGLLQTLSDTNGPLYFYAITNKGAAVGLFANRNHQAVLLAMLPPMLAVLASEYEALGKLLTLLAGLVLLPLILITGSRSGLVVSVAGLLAIPLILGWRPQGGDAISAKSGRHRTILANQRWGAALLAAGLLGLTIWLGRGDAWDRLQNISPEGETRLQILPTLISMIRAYFPVGTGMGSFEKVYLIHEPDALLSNEYMNHAHNDWLEVLLTGGAAAGLVLLVAVVAFCVQLKRAFLSQAAASKSLVFARLGLVLLLLAGLASTSDYPLRTPMLASLFALATLWGSCTLPQRKALGCTS